MSADLPYAGTSGWSGTDTSQERALQQDASGVTAQRQAKTLALVEAEGERGLTVVDLRTLTGWHHGQASGMLSVLHKVGRIERLTERRGRCHVYVHPTHRQGREAQPHGRQDPKEQIVKALMDLRHSPPRDMLDIVEKLPSHREARLVGTGWHLGIDDAIRLIEAL